METDSSESPESRESPEVPATVLLEVARCRGTSLGVYSLSEALPVDCEPLESQLPPGQWLTMLTEFGSNDRTEPLEPPPRFRKAA